MTNPPCTHDLAVREMATHDGQCSICANAEIRSLRSRLRRVEGAVLWALGEGGSFAPPVTSGGERPPPFWWRSELRLRAFGKEVERGS